MIARVGNPPSMPCLGRKRKKRSGIRGERVALGLSVLRFRVCVSKKLEKMMYFKIAPLVRCFWKKEGRRKKKKNTLLKAYQ